MFKFLFVMFFFFILLVFLMGFSILRTFKNMLAEAAMQRKGNSVVRQVVTPVDNVSRIIPLRKIMRPPIARRSLLRTKANMSISKK